jgi:hypothetical protein
VTTSLLALLAGLFLVPLAALVLGHRVNRRPRRHRTTFWGLVIGHTLAALVATIAALYLPVRWDAADTTRGLLGLWSMLLGGAIGGAIGWMLGGRSEGAAD